MRRERPGKPAAPEPIGETVAQFLKNSGLEQRVEQSSVVPDWKSLVGPQISAVTEPLFVTQDGILFVAVKTNSWMTELSLLEPQLLASLNTGQTRLPVRKIRFRLLR